MITKILVPTDFSACAKNAVKYAAQLAQKLKAELTLYHVYTIPVVDPAVPGTAYESMIAELETAARKNLAKATAGLQKAYPSLNVKSKSQTGFAISAILDLAKRSKFNLIVMGTRGASGIEEVMVGSNTASVLEKASCPVLAIPERAKYAPIKNILYPTDLSMPEAKAFHQLTDFARTSSAAITVVHIKNEMDRFFKTPANPFNNYKGYNKVKYEEFTSEKVFDALNKYMNKGDFDLVAMATHSRGFFDKLFHRSLTKRMAYHTKIPLLSFRKD